MTDTTPGSPPADLTTPTRLTIGRQFGGLVAAFSLLFLCIAIWLTLDQRALLHRTQALQSDVIDKTMDRLRLAHNLQQMRTEATRALADADPYERERARFLVSAISNYPATLADRDAAAIAREVQALVDRISDSADPQAHAAAWSDWRDLSERLSLVADRINVDGVNLGTADLQAMESLVRRVGLNIALALVIAGLFIAALLFSARRNLVRPLQHIRFALDQLRANKGLDDQPQVPTAEFHAIYRAIHELHDALKYRTHAETQLKQQTQHLLEMGHTAKIGAWSLEQSTQQLLWTGDPPLLQQPPVEAAASLDALLSCIAPTRRSTVKAAFELALSQAIPFAIEAPLANMGQAPHEVRWIHLTSHPQPGSAPLRGTAQDITSHKQAQAKLALAASVFTHARDGIVITNAKNRIIDVNESFTRITGYTAAEVIGQKPHILASGRHPPEFFAEMWHNLTQVGYWSGEVWNRRKNGEIYVELLTISAVPGLDATSNRYVGLFSDITSQKEYQSRLETIAHTDTLTGLPNRLLLADRVQQGLAQTTRGGGVLALAYLDLDGFKAINDTHGHDVGDQLLVSVSTHMLRTLRASDTLARIGGDEFVAVLPSLVDTRAAQSLLHRLLEAASQPVCVSGLTLQVSASIGVTFYPQPTTADPDLLLRQADQAMYQAKNQGRNRCCVFKSPSRPLELED